MKIITSVVLAMLALPALAAAPQPPQMEVLEEGPPPTLSKDPEDAPEDDRALRDMPQPPAQGRTTEVHTGGSTYKVKERSPIADERAPRSTTQWTLKEFGKPDRKKDTPAANQ